MNHRDNPVPEMLKGKAENIAEIRRELHRKADILGCSHLRQAVNCLSAAEHLTKTSADNPPSFIVAAQED